MKPKTWQETVVTDCGECPHNHEVENYDGRPGQHCDLLFQLPKGCPRKDITAQAEISFKAREREVKKWQDIATELEARLLESVSPAFLKEAVTKAKMEMWADSIPTEEEIDCLLVTVNAILYPNWMQDDYRKLIAQMFHKRLEERVATGRYKVQIVAQARKEERERVFGEVEEMLGIPKTDKVFQMTVTIYSEQWQACKEGEVKP